MMSKLASKVFAAMAISAAYAGIASAQHVSPKQDLVDASKDETALNEAISAKNKSETALATSRFPTFSDEYGKSGMATVDEQDRDEFHVTARTAEAYRMAARVLADALPESSAGKTSILLTDADRDSVAVYFKESQQIGAINRSMCALIDDKELIKRESFGAELFGVGSLLSEIAQFTKVFRSDKSVSFTSTDLADGIFFDLLAVAAGNKLIYPAGGVDALLDGSYATEFAKAVRTMTRCRTAAPKVPITSDKDKATVAAVDALATELSGTDKATGLPVLLLALRGELVKNSLASANAFLTVKVAAKGGVSLKTSSIWRGDRLYAAGGIVVAFRLTEKGDPSQGNFAVPKVLMADVITRETNFVPIPLEK